jgi:RNA polymerase sigma-70 factor (ECF subfamily)
MADPPTTQPSLLVRIRNARDAAAWQEFVHLYAPVIYGFARKRGLQDCDAADVTQDALRAVAGAAVRFDYDPARGSFRGWLFTIVRHKLQNFLASRQRRHQGSGDSAVQERLDEQAAPEPEESALWNKECERELLARAVERLRGSFHDSTWQAFWQTAMEGKKARQVAANLRMSVAAVYMAKSRVTALLRHEIQAMKENCEV